MVRVKYKGQLGNNLFQYSLGRIIAEETGRKLVASPIPGFPETRTEVDGTVGEGSPIICSGQTIDLDHLLRSDLDRPILLEGYFQRYEYYRDHASDIQVWLRPGSSPEVAPGPADVVVHVRVGDVRKPCRPNAYRPVPRWFYETVLRRLTWARLLVVSNDPDDPLTRYVEQEFGGTVVSVSVQSDFETLRCARRIVMSASTFSWWAAWLSDADEIYLPTTGTWNPSVRWAFASVRDVDLVVDQPRYRYPHSYRLRLEGLYPYYCRLYHALRRRGLLVLRRD